jgi:hypothetical protein
MNDIKVNVKKLKPKVSWIVLSDFVKFLLLCGLVDDYFVDEYFGDD